MRAVVSWVACCLSLAFCAALVLARRATVLGVVLDGEHFLPVVILAYVGDLGACESVGDCGGWAGIDGHGKGFACECVMDFGGDGEDEQTKEAVAKVGSNGGGVGIEGKLEVF
jgi:hypothetical protein